MAKAQAPIETDVDIENPYTEFDADFQWEKVATETPTAIEMKIGEFFIGKYEGPVDVHTENVSDNSTASDGQPGFTIQTWREITNDMLVSLPNSYKLEQGLREGNVQPGDITKVTYVKDVKMGPGRNPMKDFTIHVARGMSKK